MKYDICFAAYNSQKWLASCVAALAALDYDKSDIALYFADNASYDSGLVTLEKLKKQYSDVFGAFEILPLSTNSGFGSASNAAARCGKGEYVLFLNIDTEIMPSALTELDKAIQAADAKTVGFELRQYPYEHPKYYDPITMQVSWCSGACFALRRDIFTLTGGFDESIFLYGEDVELSFHVRALGYKLCYVPSAVTQHYAYKEAGETKPQQLIGSIVGNLTLRYKYGTQEDISKWQAVYDHAVLAMHIDEKLKAEIDKKVDLVRAKKRSYRNYYRKTVRGTDFKAVFEVFEYEFARAGAFVECKVPSLRPTFSVIVRTYKRPLVLALTLQSLTHQTYKDFEVIVVEDGVESCAKEVVENAKADLNIRYVPMNRQAGRCVAGNEGIKNAGGDFIVFLDDDDYFFADALETFAVLYSDKPKARLLAAGSIEGKCRYDNDDKTSFTFVSKHNMGKKSLSMFDFAVRNPLPIQAIAFSRELALEQGGLDETLDAFEDWDLWQRYLNVTPIFSTDKATSIFKTPYDDSQLNTRASAMAKYFSIVYDRMADYKIKCSAKDIYKLTNTYASVVNVDADAEAELDVDELRRTANEIRHSTSWRITAPLRLIVALPYFIILKIPGYVFFGLTRLFTKLSAYYRRLTDSIGPMSGSVDKMSVDVMINYVHCAEKSVCMRFAKWIQKRLHK